MKTIGRIFPLLILIAYCLPLIGQKPLQVIGTNADLAPGSEYILLGEENGLNIIIDNNEILARDNGSISSLVINADGGPVRIGTTPTPAAFSVSGFSKFGDGSPGIKTKMVEGMTTTGISTVALNHTISNHLKILSASVIAGNGTALVVGQVGTITQTQLLMSSALPDNTPYRIFIVFRE